jgi:hypothetical protein
VFRFLRKLFGRRDPFGYTPAEREIFEFWDGHKVRLADPLTVQRALVTDPELDAKLDTGLLRIPGEPGLNAAGRIAAAVRRAFKVPDLEHGGLSEGECISLFCTFGDYIGGLTELARPLASSPPPTGSAAPESSPTPTSAASGSTAVGQVATPTAP